MIVLEIGPRLETVLGGVGVFAILCWVVREWWIVSSVRGRG